jgi:hypothetical protein
VVKVDNQTVYIENQRSKARWEPHELEDTVDPFKNNKSDLYRAGIVVTCFLEVVDVIVFFATLNRDILFKISIFNPVSFLAIIAFITIPVLWFAVMGTQRRLDENAEKVKCKWRVKKKVDSFSKWDDKTPEQSIRKLDGIKSFDPETGLSEHLVNEKKWAVDDHPYLGQHAFDLIAYVKTTDDEEIIIDNLFEAGKSLKIGGVLVRTIMYSGEDICNVLDDIEKKLADPNIDEVRQKALYSVYNHYVGREGNYEPIYLMHFGLPYTASKEKALEFMREIRDEYEVALNERGIETVLIKDSDIMVTIMEGIFSGKMHFTGDIIEN